MPEGPSIIMFKEELMHFRGKKVLQASGVSKTIEPEQLKGRTITDLKSFGKHLLLGFGDELTLRIHFLMFGTYRINDTKDAPVRLHLGFAKKEELNFYTCSLRFIEGPLDDVYDWSGDIMNESWDEKAALKKLRALPEDAMICDALMNQDIFAGLGNIIKNEILFRTQVQPESMVHAIPAKKLKELVQEAVKYSFEFLAWRREGTLRKHWQAHNQKICPQDKTPFQKGHPGKLERRSFWCEACMVRYR